MTYFRDVHVYSAIKYLILHWLINNIQKELNLKSYLTTKRIWENIMQKKLNKEYFVGKFYSVSIEICEIILGGNQFQSLQNIPIFIYNNYNTKQKFSWSEKILINFRLVSLLSFTRSKIFIQIYSVRWYLTLSLMSTNSCFIGFSTFPRQQCL